MAGKHGSGGGTGGTGGGGQQKVTIPVKYRAALKQSGYDGPWTVTRARLKNIIDGLQNQNPGTDPNSPDLTDVIAALTSALGGGSSSGGSAGMTAKQKNNLRNSYLEQLNQWRIGLDKNMQALIEQGVKQEWSTVSFRMHLRETQEYRDQFPQIKGSTFQGNEGAYLQARDRFKEAANAVGANVSNKQFALLVDNRVTLQEWQSRMQFFERADASRPFFNQIEAVAKARGLMKPHEKFNEHDLWKLMTHRGDPAIQKLVDEATIRTSLSSIGFQVGPKGDIARHRVLQLMNNTIGLGGDPTRIDFSKLANDFRTIVPAAEAVGAGITKNDLFTLEFGGRDQMEIARHAQAILESYQNIDSQRQQEGLVQTQHGPQLSSGGAVRPTGV